MTKLTDSHIEFDPTDWAGNVSLMNRHEEFDQMLFGKNELGEDITISINKDNITVVTFQDNGWSRENIYYEDGTNEESYHRF